MVLTLGRRRPDAASHEQKPCPRVSKNFGDVLLFVQSNDPEASSAQCSAAWSRAFERWIPPFLEKTRHSTDRKLVRSPATWQHPRILRRKSEITPTTHTQIVSVRSDHKACTELVNWLRDRDLDLATCGQGDIDAFLATGPKSRRRAKTLAEWTSRHRFPNLLSTKAISTRNPTPIEEAERWALTRKLLHSQTIALTDRFAGLLILLFGQRVSKIVTLTADDLNQSDRL